MSLASAPSPLPRRGYVGLRLALRSEAGAVEVSAVAPQSPSARAGVAVGDALVALEGRAYGSLAAWREAFGALRAGDRVALSVRRGGEGGATTTLSCDVDERPREAHPGLRLRYETLFSRDGVRLRTLLLEPPAERFEPPYPAVLLLQGYPCESVERVGAGAAADPWYALADALAHAGLLVARLERRGLGDSEGGPCERTDFETEQRDYDDALVALLRAPEVDPARVALWGYSLGAQHAAVLAGAARAPHRVAALVLFGTGLYTFTEYLAANLRRTRSLRGADEARLEALVRAQNALHAAWLVQGRPLAEALSLAPLDAQTLAALGVEPPRSVLGRDERYWRQVYASPLAVPLRAAGCPVLALWGESDAVTTREEHEALARYVDALRPGHGDVAALPRVDHALREADSAAASLAGPPGPAAGVVAAASAAWLGVRLGLASP